VGIEKKGGAPYPHRMFWRCKGPPGSKEVDGGKFPQTLSMAKDKGTNPSILISPKNWKQRGGGGLLEQRTRSLIRGNPREEYKRKKGKGGGGSTQKKKELAKKIISVTPLQTKKRVKKLQTPKNDREVMHKSVSELNWRSCKAPPGTPGGAK